MIGMWKFLLQSLAQLSQYGWVYALAAAVFAFLAILEPANKTYKYLKYHRTPRLRAEFTYPNRDGDSVQEYHRTSVEDDTAIVPPKEQIRLGIAINSDYIYTPHLVEISGDGDFDIKQDHIFTEDDRPWEIPYPDSDLHGNYKVQIDGIRITPDDKLIIDVCLSEPLEVEEEKRLTVSVKTEEAKKPFEQDMWVKAGDNSSE